VRYSYTVRYKVKLQDIMLQLGYMKGLGYVVIAKKSLCETYK